MKSSFVKTGIITIVFLFISQLSFAQWAGSSDTLNSIYRFGNVGIGTDTPIEKLDINGSLLLRDGTNTNLYLRNPGGTGNSLIFWQEQNGSADYYLGQTTENGDLKIYNYDSDSFHITFKKGGNTIFDYGNVGIGTTTPASKLHVSQGSIRIDNNKSLQSINPGGTQTGNLISTTASNIMELGQSGRWDGLGLYSGALNHTMFLDNTGNVGIGTSSPISQVHIYENTDVHNAMYLETSSSTKIGKYALKNDEGRSGYIAFSGSNTANSISVTQPSNLSVVGPHINLVAQNAAGLIKMFTGGSGFTKERMRIDSDGNVGIGTADTFGYKLAVNGTIGAKEVIVETTSAWPDYVFDEVYELRSLEEVEQFTKEHKHLPNVPNQSEVKEKGINLGEMDAILLKKIEELTLYMIETNKKVSSLEAEISRLKNENERLRNP